jgi:photosystem II stability/assembly factor-like uncharacterized protein
MGGNVKYITLFLCSICALFCLDAVWLQLNRNDFKVIPAIIAWDIQPQSSETHSEAATPTSRASRTPKPTIRATATIPTRTATRVPTRTVSTSKPKQASYISFVSVQEGWMSRDDAILYTSDGGEHWRKIATLTDVSRIDFVSAKVGWAQSLNRLYRSNDGGKTWQQVYQLANREERIWGIDFIDEQYGWVVTNHANYFTNDGGRTLQKTKQPCHADHNVGASYLSGPDAIWQVCWLGGIAGFRPNSLHFSQDQGQTWQTLVPVNFEQALPNMPASGFAYQIVMRNPQEGWIVTDDTRFGDLVHRSKLFFTQDGGQSWSSLGTVAEGTLRSLNFVSPQIGFILASKNDQIQLLKTEDGGLTWKVIYQK